MGKERTRHKRRLGDLPVSVLRFTKSELAGVPAPHRSFYLLLGQFNNELTILHGLLFQAVNGVRGPDVAQEPALGMVLFLARSMGGRLYELRGAINNGKNSQLLAQLWDAQPMAAVDKSARIDGEEGRHRLNRYFGQKKAFLSGIRNKLAYHLDQTQMDAGFERLPDEVSLADFHTGIRGTTFYGAADTVALYASADLANLQEGFATAQQIMAETHDVFVGATEFINAYMFAFNFTYFGVERIRGMPVEILHDVPALAKSRLHFFFRAKMPEV